MFNKVREVLQSTQWDLLFRRILRFSITNCLIRQNNLCIALCAKCSRLEKRFFVNNAFLINVKSRIYVVYSINHKVQILPEFIVKDMLVFWRNSKLKRLNRFVGEKTLIHCLAHCSQGLLRFGLSDIGGTEEKLAAQVGRLDTIVVSDCQWTRISTANAKESKLL